MYQGGSFSPTCLVLILSALFPPLMSLDDPVEDAKPLELGYIIPRGLMIEFAMWELHIFG